MGSCGCGDYHADFRLPGPNGIVYTIALHRGCEECGTPHGLVIHRHDTEGQRAWRTDEVPELPFVPYDGGYPIPAEASLAVLHPDDLRDAIREHLESADREDWPVDEPEAWAIEMSGAPLDEAVHRTLMRTEVSDG